MTPPAASPASRCSPRSPVHLALILIASRFVSWAGSRTLAPDLTKSGIAGEGRCALFVPNGAPTSEEDPHAGFDRMGNFIHFSYQSPTAAHLHNNVMVPLVGALDRPAGSYDVVVKCQGTGQFNQLYTLWSADLSVTAALK